MHDNFIKQTLQEGAFENNSKELHIYAYIFIYICMCINTLSHGFKFGEMTIECGIKCTNAKHTVLV